MNSNFSTYESIIDDAITNGTWLAFETLLVEGKSLKEIADDFFDSYGSETIGSYLIQLVVGETPLTDKNMAITIRQSTCKLIELFIVDGDFCLYQDQRQLLSMMDTLEVIFKTTFEYSSEVGDAASHLFGVMVNHVEDYAIFCGNWENLSHYLEDTKSYVLKSTLIALISVASNPNNVKRYSTSVVIDDGESNNDAINRIVLETNEFLNKPDVDNEIKTLGLTLLRYIGNAESYAIVEYLEDLVKSAHKIVEQIKDPNDSKYIEVGKALCNFYCMLVAVYTEAVTDYTEAATPCLVEIFDGILKLSESHQFEIVNATCAAWQAVAAAAKIDNRTVKLFLSDWPHLIDFFTKVITDKNDQVRLASCLAVGEFTVVFFQCYRSNPALFEAPLSKLLALLLSRFHEDSAWHVRHAICGVLLTFIETSEESDAFFVSGLLSMTEKLLAYFPKLEFSDWDINFELILALLRSLENMYSKDHGMSELKSQNECITIFKPLFDEILMKVVHSDLALTLPLLHYLKHTMKFYNVDNSNYINAIFIKCIKFTSDLMQPNNQQLFTYHDDYITVILDLFATAAKNLTVLVNWLSIFDLLIFYFNTPQTENVQVAAFNLMIAAFDLMIVAQHQSLRNIHDHILPILQRALESLLSNNYELQWMSVTILKLIKVKCPNSITQFIQSNLYQDDQVQEEFVIIAGRIGTLDPSLGASIMYPDLYHQCIYTLYNLDKSSENVSILIGICQSFLHKLNEPVRNELPYYSPVIKHMLRFIFQYDDPIGGLAVLFYRIKNTCLMLLDKVDEAALQEYLFDGDGN